MGCSGSKSEDLPLVVRCRERRNLIRAAANHRYALAAAHVSYFRSLTDVGDALRKFVDEELVLATSTPSSSSSPSLILPRGSSKKNADDDGSSSLHLHDDDESHLNLSDSEDSDGSEEDSEDYHHHGHRGHHHHDSEDDDDNRIGHQHGSKGFDGKGARNLHNEEEGSSYNYYPRGVGFSGYGYGGDNGFGDGMVNDPFAFPYPHPHPHPHPHPYPQNPTRYREQEPYMGMGMPPPEQQQQPYYSTNSNFDHWASPQGMPPDQPYNNYSSNVYYMKKSAPAARTVVQEPPTYSYSDSYWGSYTNNGDSYGGGGYFPMESHSRGNNETSVKVKEAPPPPSPKASTWDFFNPFDVYDNAYNSSGRFGYGSIASSPDSTEVREREGIPELEEETESEVYKDVVNGKRGKGEAKRGSRDTTPRSSAGAPVPKSGDGSSSRSVPLHGNEGSSRSVPFHKSENSSRSLPSWSSEDSEKPSMPPQGYNVESVVKSSMPPVYGEQSGKPSMSPHLHSKGTTSWGERSSHVDITGSSGSLDEKSSQEHVVSKSVDDASVKKKGVTFEVEEISKQDPDSSQLSSVVLSPHGTRDLKEVVAEIRDEFETAAGYGKEVAMLLEVGKLPYQPSFLKVILSRILYLISPSVSLPDPPSAESVKLASKTAKLAKSYFEDVGNDVNSKPCNLSSTMDKLYAWEKKLYKEVKDEERLRVIYEKQCKRLRMLDEQGAEASKIDATRASIRRLLTKLDVSVKAIDAISSRIHKLRDEELQPQVASLIHGLIRMWKAMFKCHQKQFHAIMDSKMRKLKVNTALETDSTSRVTTQLERELRAWCNRFNDWIGFQKSYVDSLNGWLLQCLQCEPEETPDGPIPYSPGRLGAPPIFVICNDWHQAMEAISEARVANALNGFATSLRQLWEKQDEEGRQRLKAEYLSKDFEKHLKTHRVEGGKTGREQDAMSDKTGLSVVRSDSGVSPLDDLKVDLDSMRQKLAEERIKHKDAMKLVQNAASSSLQGGLVPIFKALENFTSEALKAHEHVRLEHAGPS